MAATHIVATVTVGAALLAALALPASSEDVKKVDFVKDVKPVLEAACVKCHGLKDAKGRYRIDAKAAAFKGGEVAQKGRKPAIIPGKADESLLVAFIEATDKDEEKHIEPMPPRKEERRLSDVEKALIRRWIAEGAPWPEKVTLASPEGAAGGSGGRRRR